MRNQIRHKLIVPVEAVHQKSFYSTLGPNVNAVERGNMWEALWEAHTLRDKESRYVWVCVIPWLSWWMYHIIRNKVQKRIPTVLSNLTLSPTSFTLVYIKRNYILERGFRPPILYRGTNIKHQAPLIGEKCWTTDYSEKQWQRGGRREVRKDEV